MYNIVDFHSHILPGVDDGSADVEESLSMLRMEAEQGIRSIVATPHFYARHDTPERFLRRRAAAYEVLHDKLNIFPESPQIYLGAEVYYFPGMSDSDVLSELTIAHTGHILLEMPHAPWTESMYREIEGIYVKLGIVPIIAHVDRYISPFWTHGISKRLAELPVLVQANAEFFLERGTSKMAMRMLKADQIHLLGSDCHNMESRKPNLGEAIRRIQRNLGPIALERIGRYEKQILEE